MKKISGEICGAGHVVDSVNYIKIIWFSLIVSLPGLDLPSPDYLQAETVNRKGILFHEDFEDGISSNDWNTMPYGNSITVSTEQARSGSKSMKAVKLPVGTPCDGCGRGGVDFVDNHCEIILWKQTTPKINNFEFNKIYWIGWSVFIPSDFPPIPSTGGWFAMGQFHDAPDPCDNNDTSPTMAFFYQTGDRWCNVILGTASECKLKGENDRGWVAYDTPQFKRGAWNDIVIQVKWDYRVANGPFIKGWLNDVQYINDSGINCWNDLRGPTFRVGFYATPIETMTAYYDDFRFGDATSDYASVAPGTSSNPPPSAPRGLTVK